MISAVAVRIGAFSLAHGMVEVRMAYACLRPCLSEMKAD